MVFSKLKMVFSELKMVFSELKKWKPVCIVGCRGVTQLGGLVPVL